MIDMESGVTPEERSETQASEHRSSGGSLTYTVSLSLAVTLTGLVVLAIAQMGVHLVFFLHITTEPDSTNNILALAFDALIGFLMCTGSLVIIGITRDHGQPEREHDGRLRADANADATA